MIAVAVAGLPWLGSCILREVFAGEGGLIDEKGMVASAARLDVAPPDFAERARGLLGEVGRSPEEIAQTIARAQALIEGIRA